MRFLVFIRCCLTYIHIIYLYTQSCIANFKLCTFPSSQIAATAVCLTCRPDIVCPNRLGGMMQPAKAAHGAFSQPAVLSALLVIRLFGIVIPPPYFPKEHQKEHCGREMVAALLHYVLWCASEYSVVGRISHRSSMITLEQTFFNDASEYLFPR